MRALGVDMGDRFIGVAVSDSSGRIALPVEVVDRKGSPDALGAVGRLARELGAEVIVVGLPLGMDGGEWGQAARIREQAAELERAGGLPVELCDERLSSSAAGALSAPATKRRRGRLDASAAAVILQAWLDAR